MKVIFREFDTGEVVAIFPEIPGDSSPLTCGSYMHFGMHSSCDPGIIRYTKPAKNYENLKAELESIGYDLEIIKRNRRDFLLTRIHILRRKK